MHIEFDQEKLTEAAQRVEATLKICRDTFPEGHVDTIAALALLADIYEKQGETKEQAVRKEIAELTGDDTGSQLVVELKQLTAAAEKLQGEGKLAEATQIWENAIAAKRKKLGDSHREVVPLIHAFGVHLFQSMDYGKAESVIQEASPDGFNTSSQMILWSCTPSSCCARRCLPSRSTPKLQP
ncbi:MAG: hypothetical protein R3C49_19615 [Planctomycetaceae bacterium]